MAKTKEELNKLKEEYELLAKKINDLSEDELKEIIGGSIEDMPRKKEEEKYVMATRPTPVPIKPIVSKNCLHKPCIYGSKNECPYYEDDIGDCKY